jgi:hypothetical protein
MPRMEKARASVKISAKLGIALENFIMYKVEVYG